MKFRHIALVAVLAPVTFAACSSDGNDHASMTSTAATLAPLTSTPGAAHSAEFGDADVEFLQGMIPHHQQAVEMAEMALDPTVGASPAVVAFATRIKAAQDPEIEQMTSWLTAWGQPVQMDTSGGHDMSSMDGMMTAAEMDGLTAAKGADFDTMWRDMMIRHHQGAITMAEQVKTSGSNPDVSKLADQIITVQQAEVTELQALQGG